MKKEEIIRKYGNAQEDYWQLQNEKINRVYVSEFDKVVRSVMEGVINNGFEGRFYKEWRYFFHLAARVLVNAFGESVDTSILGYEMAGMWLDWYYGGRRMIFIDAVAKINREAYWNVNKEDMHRVLFTNINEYYKSLDGYWTEYLNELNPNRLKLLINVMPTDKMAHLLAEKAINELGFDADYFNCGLVEHPEILWEDKDYIIGR